MRSPTLLACCTVLFSALPVGAQAPLDLTSSHTLSGGDYAALLVGQALKFPAEIGELEATPLVMFNPINERVIDINLLGTKNRVEDARLSVEQVVKWIQEYGTNLVRQHTGLAVSPTDFRIYYHNRTASDPRQVILAWSRGQYLTPGQP